jgi:ankyrin repeat protein
MAILKSPIIAQSLDAKDNFRCTPLHNAATSKSLDAVKHCVQYSDKDSRTIDHAAERSMLEDRQYCNTPLSIAVSSGDEESAMFLLGQGASTKITLSHGNTLLHLCATSGLLKVCRHLLEPEGLNPLVHDNYGQLPMHLAARNDHLNVFECLHRFCTTQAIPAYGIDLVDKDGHDALFYAIEASATGNLSI